jgi:amino acid transporter
VYRWPAYRKDTVQFISVLYGISFIFFGTMAGNAINCGVEFLKAAHPERENPDNAQVRGIAVTMSVAALFIHALSRRGGLALNNLFALVKLGMLLVIISTTIAYSAGSIGPSPALERTPWAQQPLFDHKGISRNNTLLENLSLPYSFDHATHDSHSYSDAFLDVIFTFSGFEQANYVLGEINQPHRKFPVALGLSASIVSVLFLAVNICYWVVVPQYIAAKPDQNIAEAFFTITLGSLRPDDPYLGKRIACAFIAISALGNVIVMSYTATRVKQELAKEGFLPFPQFLASNYDISIGRFLAWMQQRSILPLARLFKTKWLAPSNFREKTPVGASILHILTCFILIAATSGMQATDAYSLLTNIAAYLINGFFGFFLALGILWLRLFRGKEWKEKSTHIRPSVSIAAATIYLLFNAWPVIANWIPSHQPSILKWYLIPLVSWIVLACGLLWYLGFLMIVRRIDKQTGTVLVIRKVPDVREDPPFSKRYRLEHETAIIDRLLQHEADGMELHEATNTEARRGAQNDDGGVYLDNL